MVMAFSQNFVSNQIHRKNNRPSIVEVFSMAYGRRRRIGLLRSNSLKFTFALFNVQDKGIHTTLLNSEECALSEEKKKKNSFRKFFDRYLLISY